MKVTNIKQQVKNPDRVSVFVDGAYNFSLSVSQWQDSGLKVGDTLSPDQLTDFKRQSEFGKLFDKALAYLARRRRSEYELRQYFFRKKVAPEEIDQIVEKLYKLKYLDDKEFARAWVNDRNLLKPTSQRKLRMELRKKGIDGDTIDAVLASSEDTEASNLQRIIESKRRQQRYQDDQKLLLYLTRQGFSYSEAVQAMKNIQDQEQAS